mgnify:CR=1 FL=1
MTMTARAFCASGLLAISSSAASANRATVPTEKGVNTTPTLLAVVTGGTRTDGRLVFALAQHPATALQVVVGRVADAHH